jgi:hypothetical protein
MSLAFILARDTTLMYTVQSLTAWGTYVCHLCHLPAEDPWVDHFVSLTFSSYSVKLE